MIRYVELRLHPTFTESESALGSNTDSAGIGSQLQHLANVLFNLFQPQIPHLQMKIII